MCPKSVSPWKWGNNQKSMCFLEQQGTRLCFQAKVNEGTGKTVVFSIENTNKQETRMCHKWVSLCFLAAEIFVVFCNITKLFPITEVLRTESSNIARKKKMVDYQNSVNLHVPARTTAKSEAVMCLPWRNTTLQGKKNAKHWNGNHKKIKKKRHMVKKISKIKLEL